jgi:hypothetical protein
MYVEMIRGEYDPRMAPFWPPYWQIEPRYSATARETAVWKPARRKPRKTPLPPLPNEANRWKVSQRYPRRPW